MMIIRVSSMITFGKISILEMLLTISAALLLIQTMYPFNNSKQGKMETLKMDNVTDRQEFYCLSKDAYVRINRISIKAGNNFCLDSLNLKIMLRYIIHETEEFIDDRIDEIPIHLEVDANQENLIFNFNKTFATKIFKIGWSDKEYYFSDLAFVFEDSGNAKMNYSLFIEYEMFEMSKKESTSKNK
jgi:hypothetical protein